MQFIGECACIDLYELAFDIFSFNPHLFICHSPNIQFLK